MKRALIVLLLAVGFGLSAGRAEAQVTIQLGNSGDSAVAVLASATTSVLVTANNPVYNYTGCYYAPYYFYDYYCLSYAQLTFVYDPALIDSIGVEPTSPGFPTLSGTSPASGRFTVTASGGAGGYQAQLFRLRIKLAAGASDGGYLWARVDSLAAPLFPNITDALSTPAPVCHATNMWGDVDGSGRIDSRDALITLSAAVGLPVSGFSLGFGDVDSDGLTNSRDALMMLSYSIALRINTTNRIGVAIADACPGLTAPGETVVFRRGLSQGGGGGIYRLDSLSTVPVQLTADPSDVWPRLNAAGTTVAFQCMDPLLYNQTCLMDLAGTNRRMITGPGTEMHLTPDWSPDGAKLAYAQTNGIPPTLFTMDTSGANRVQAGPQAYPGTIAWSHDGSKLAYMDWNTGIVSTITTDTMRTVVSLGATGRPLVRWSPGDTLVAYLSPSFTILGVPAAGGTPVPVVRIAGVRDFDWSPAGIVFNASLGNQSGIWMLRGGPSGTLVRLTAPVYPDVDGQPSLRRTP